MAVPPQFEQHFDMFFQDPAVEPRPVVPNQSVQVGVLYLLRRDVNKCRKADAPIPAAMAILAGIDLLGKSLAGEDTSGVGDRFRAFVSAYFGKVRQREAAQLYQLRNALLHSFGLYSKETRNGKTVAEYFFVIHSGRSGRPDKGLVVEQYQGSRYFVGVSSLSDSFEHAVDRYKTDLLAKTQLRTNFESMWPYYGSQTLTLEPPLQ